MKNKALLTTVLTGGLLLAASPANAAPMVTLTGEYSGPIYSQSPVVATLSGSVANLDVNTSALPFAYQGNSAVGMADDTGNFTLSAWSDWGGGSTTATYSYVDTIHNMDSTANTYAYNFFVPSIYMGLRPAPEWWADYSGQPSVATASYSYQVLVNSINVFQSSATVSIDSYGNRGDDLSADLFGFDIASRSSNPYSGMVNLGILNPGKDLSLQILVSLNASLSNGCISDCMSFAGASFGDPSDIAAQPAGFSIVSTPASVPVPASIWLFASGLFGLAGLKRNKKTTIC